MKKVVSAPLREITHSKARSPFFFPLILCAAASAMAAPSPAAAGGRAALVIGNSAYAANPLPNPVNDATDIAAALEGAGFEVILRTDQDLAGMTPLKLTLAIGTVRLNIRWADPYSGFSQRLDIEEGKAVTVSASENSLKVGDIGPAGGLIFYDKGKVSDGWRYLEAAPEDQSAGIQWYNGEYIGIKTGTAVGTGRANTEAIIATQGIGNYAATLCKDLTINGYSDWFLPSRDELNLMYTNLKKAGLGGFGSGWLWSSSQNDYSDGGDAWEQRFSDGNRGTYDEAVKYSVRACRAF